MVRVSRPRGWRGWLAVAAVLLTALVLVAVTIWWDDIVQSTLDPELPYSVYRPPPAPDYNAASSWALDEGATPSGARRVDVFFMHPTTFNGGRHWNGSIDNRAAARLMARVMLPNYAEPFASVGRVFAPYYRQASIYTSLTLFDDAIEAREFPYADTRTAFFRFLRRIGPDRPFIVVGVEQGGGLAARLLSDEIAPEPNLRRRLVAAYLQETVVPADEHGSAAKVPACRSQDQSGCLVAWISAPWLDFGRGHRIMTRSLVWNASGHLRGLGGRAPLCVNPLLGAQTDLDAPARLNRGAANASGLEWGTRPGFMARQVGARCVDGILRISDPRSALLRPSGVWVRRLRVAAYNLFWADLEADSQGRASAWFAANRRSLTPPH